MLKMMPASARRTALCGNGRGKECGLASQTIKRYESAYLFGAICPARGVRAALAPPFADTETTQLHREEISPRRRGRPRRPAIKVN
jgi:hypothetical protein